MSARFSVVAMALGLVVASPVFASDAGYIYGRVETVDGDSYKGQLRWGHEESFWDDIFNATKAENENLEFVDDRVLDNIRRRQRGGWDFLGGNDHVFDHLFAVRFGDLKYLRPRRGDELVAGFRNGQELRLKGGSNDVGADILVVDPELGQQTVAWKHIRRIEFLKTPAQLAAKVGEPIYGTVRSGRYDYTGRIQWDHDECLTVDKLDGQTSDGKLSIAFGDIASIRKHRSGAEVTLKSGRTVYLTGTNDVNGENRGVVVLVPKLGSVRIGWKDFDEVTFERAPSSGHGYEDYAEGRELMGSVTAPGGPWNGQIVFDLDEAYDFELLHGTIGDTQFLVPFRNIVSIRPHGTRRTDVELRSGITLELEHGQDVTSKNHGVLVFTGGRDPKYVAWKDISEVMLR